MRIWSRLSGTRPGGTEAVAARLALDMRRLGHEVRLCVPPAPALDEWAATVGAEGVEIERQAEVMSKWDGAGLWRAARSLAAYQPDLVHLHLNHATADRYLPFVIPARAVAVSTEHVRHDGASASLKFIKRLGSRRIARVVCVSHAVKTSLETDYGLQAPRLQVIANGVDTARFHPGDRAEARRALDLPAVGFVVGSAGRLTHQKGFDILLRACARMEGAWVLAIAGEGEDDRKLMALALELGVSERVRWLGPLENMERFYPALDAFALASRWEGLPLTLLEALACGLPAVCAGVDGILEVLAEGGGVMVPPESPQALGAVLEVWRAHESLRRQVAQDALRVAQHYDWNRTLEQYAALYQEVTAWKTSSSRQWW